MVISVAKSFALIVIVGKKSAKGRLSGAPSAPRMKLLTVKPLSFRCQARREERA
jgi:hypothetical protein